MDNNLIKLSTFFYNKQNILITKNKLIVLMEQKILTTHYINDEIYFNVQEVLDLLQVKKNISEDFFTANEFLQKISRISSASNYIEQLDEIHTMCNKIYKIHTIKHQDSIYFSKIDVEKFLLRVSTKNEAIKKLDLNPYIFEQIINEAKIHTLRISKNTEYLLNTDLDYLKVLSKKFSYKQRKATWIKGVTIIKSKVFSEVVKKNETLKKQCIDNSISYFIDKEKILYVNYHSYLSFYRRQLKLKKEYYTLTDLKKLLSVSISSLTTLQSTFLPNLFEICDHLNILYIKSETKLSGQNVHFNKQQIDEFLANYISNSDVVNNFKVSFNQLNYLVDYNKINYFILHKNLRFYKRLDMQNIFHNNDKTLLYLKRSNKFYTLKETLELLNISPSELIFVRKESRLPSLTGHGTTYYYKKDVESLLSHKKNIRENFVPSSLVTSTLGAHYFALFQTRKSPKGIERYAFDNLSSVHLLFSKSEYKEMLDSKKRKQTIDSISYDDPVSAFNKLIEIKKIQFHDNSSITKHYWLNHCIQSILYNGKSNETIPYYVNSLIKCTELISEFTFGCELYQKSNKEISLALLNDSVSINNQNFLINFINKSHSKLSEQYQNIQFKKIPYKKERKNINNLKQDMTAYSYTTFQKLYSFLNNIDHKNNAIKDSLLQLDLNSKKPKADYAYSWLYSLLHLNNAWRHSDICNIQMIDISFLCIDTIKEFTNKSLTADEANKVINLLLAKEYTVSKTNVTNNFFISDDIRYSVANAYIVCHLLNQSLHPTSSKIINFSNKQNKFLDTHNKTLFQSFSKDFKFKNRKMNRTLLTIMYTLLKHEDNVGSALNIAKRLRSHKSEESTNLYIKIPEEDMNFLSKSLFDRGIFGYIPKILNEIIFGEINNFTEETNNIVKTKSVFKDIYNIEASAGFLNNVLAQKKSVLQLFISKGPDNAYDILNKLQMNSMPGKDANFQCIVWENGCIKTGLECKNCAYSVPNFYAISNITSSITNSLKTFKENFSNSKFKIEKIKKVNLLFMELDILDHAIDKFGEEIVLEFFEGNKNGYIRLLDLLNDIDSEIPITDYATYKLKGASET